MEVSDTDGKIKEFFERLDKTTDRNKLALRRSAGKTLQNVDAAAILSFYQVLPPDVSPWEENRYFFAACVYCLIDAENENAVSIPKAMAQYYLLKDTENIQKRFTDILDTAWDDTDGFMESKLLRLIQMLRSEGYYVDSTHLLRSLLSWNSDSQFIQKKWAQEYVEATIKD